MMDLSMKQTKQNALILSLCLFPLVGHSFTGSEGRGGGDLCEDRIKVIGQDLKTWIDSGGPRGLTLPSDINIEQYSNRMLSAIHDAKIKCVGPGDVGYPVQIGKTPKYCQFNSVHQDVQIVCDNDKFMAASASDQYVLVHHEYAGIAGIEVPNKDDSNYSVSNQITGFLADQIVKKFAVHPGTSGSITNDGMVQYDHISKDGTVSAIYMPKLKSADGNYYSYGTLNYGADYQITRAICDSFGLDDARDNHMPIMAPMQSSTQYVSALFAAPQVFTSGWHSNNTTAEILTVLYCQER